MKRKIYKTLTVDDSKCYPGFLNELVDEYNKIYHRSIDKKSVDAVYSTALTEEIESSRKAPKFKFDERVRIIK